MFPPISSDICWLDPLVLTYFLEGVLVAKKDPNLPKHNEIDTKNLYVRPAMPKMPAPV